MTRGQHHIPRSKPCDTRMMHDTGGTNRLVTFRTVKRDIPEEPTTSTPLLRIALGAVVALVLAVAALGTTVAPDPDVVVPALVATVAATPPLPLDAPVVPMVEPPVLTAAVPSTVVARKHGRGECAR